MGEKLPAGILIHEHERGGSFIISQKLASMVKGKFIKLSSKKKNKLDISVKKILGKRFWSNLSDIKRIDKEISLWNIHYPSPIILPVLFISKKPKIISFHFMRGGHPFKFKQEGMIFYFLNKLSDLFFNIVFNIWVLFADKLLFITQGQKKEYKEITLFEKKFEKKSTIIPNFIERNYIKNNKKIFRKRLPKVLFIGRLEKLKGFYDLINLKRVISEGNVSFSIVGEGKIPLNKYNDFKNYGKVTPDKMKKIYDKHEILILPSYTEVFPMVILEAMARGLVILVSDLPGMREIVKEGRNGYLFPPGDIEKMKEIILYLKNNPKEIERISKNNLKDIHKFTTEKQIPKYLKVYEDILKEND